MVNLNLQMINLVNQAGFYIQINKKNETKVFFFFNNVADNRRN